MVTQAVVLQLVFLCVCQAFGQGTSQDFPVIGQRCPDFRFRGIKDFGKSEISRDELAGHFVIIDFWNKYCSMCVESFPKTNAIRKQFANELTILLIGEVDKEHRTRPMYEKVRARLNLTIPYCFDSLQFKSFVPRSVPHLVWMDKDGIVKAITTSTELTEENVRLFLAGRPFAFFDRSFSAEQQRKSVSFDYWKPFLSNGNGGEASNFLIRSILVPYNSEAMGYASLPTSLNTLRKLGYPPGLVQGCASLESLYKFAFTGYDSWYTEDSIYVKIYQKPLIDVKDNRPFQMNPATNQGLYWYSLSVPPERATADFILQAMQSDLNRCFGYQARLETRTMPCWVLTATPEAKLRLKSTSTIKQNDKAEPVEVKLTDISIGEFISTVFYKHIKGKPPIIDRTGIRYNIDVEFNTDLYDFEAIRYSLSNLGLRLGRDTLSMKVIVISDPTETFK